MQDIARTEGVDYTAYSPAHKKTIAAAASIAATIKAVLDTPILSDDGDLTEESNSVLLKSALHIPVMEETEAQNN